MLKDLYPDLCLPLEPILTRWGTWLEAAQYYYENYNKIKNVLSHLEDEAVAINTAKSLFEKPNLRNDLAFISDNCVFLAQAITQLESQNVRLTENVSNVKKVIEKVEGIPGSKGDLIRSKLVEVLSKNKGWETICQISDIISGTEVTSEHRVPFTTNEITSFSKAPITSNMERARKSMIWKASTIRCIVIMLETFLRKMLKSKLFHAKPVSDLFTYGTEYLPSARRICDVTAHNMDKRDGQLYSVPVRTAGALPTTPHLLPVNSLLRVLSLIYLFKRNQTLNSNMTFFAF
uniref:Uncharacterized protein n=1 Tax=Rhodnius prolixus TaxID=13249 RepID=T1HSU1_RHOPR